MSTAGIANPYWYEWYVGLDQVINMLNPESRISYVIFQSDIYDTIDDVLSYDSISLKRFLKKAF